MIKFREQVPSVYTNASRDFQYLSWLIDVVLNSVKHNVDTIYDLPNVKHDAKLSELLAMTLGFKVKRNYDQKQLAALVAVLPRILKYKGTKIAIDTAVNALIASSGAIGNAISEVVDNELQVTLPEKLIDVSLFTDLLPYILPAGMSCKIMKTGRVTKSYVDTFVYDSEHFAADISDLPNIFGVQNDSAGQGLSVMFSPDTSRKFTLANFSDISDENNLILNTGLLDNNIIPSIETLRFGAIPTPTASAQLENARADDDPTSSNND